MKTAMHTAIERGRANLAVIFVAVAILVGFYAGWRVLAASSQYSFISIPYDTTNWTSSSGYGPSAGPWGNAQWALYYRSTAAIPDGSSDAEIVTNIVPCMTNSNFPPQTARHVHRSSPDYNGAAFTTNAGYEVIVGTNACTPGTIAKLSVYEVGQYHWQLMSVDLPAYPGSMSSFIRNDGALPGLTVRTLGLEWNIASATGLTGVPAVGGSSVSNSINVGMLNTIDRVAPAVVSGVTTARWPHSIDAQWTASADDNGGVGLCRYELYRNGTYVASTNNTYYSFGGLTPSTSYTLGFRAVDCHNSAAAVTNVAQSTTALNTPVSQVSPRRVGQHRFAATWGGQGESIDTLSGNLNFSLPLANTMIRGGGGVPIGLTYNSQLWRGDNAGWWELGRDVGYGYGWRMLAGALTPVWVDANTFGYWLFTDGTGAEYRLDQYVNGEWKSKEGFYGAWDPGTKKLRFLDGTTWEFMCTSGATEADAGTLYPTQIKNSNGNFVTLSYRAAIGSGVTNTSSRLATTVGVAGSATFNYNTDAIPHLISTTGPPGTAQNFAYSTAAVLRPDGVSMGTKSMLQAITNAGLPLTRSFTYTTNAEMSKVVFPYGGELQWDYGQFTFASNVRIREVTQRRLVKAIGAAANTFTFTRPGGDASQPMHTALTVVDVGAAAAKDWTFSSAANYTRGMITRYDERGTSGPVLRRNDFTYVQDANGMPYTSAVTTTIDVGTANQMVTKTEQTLDVYGNATQTRAYAFNSLTTPVKTIDCVYYNPSYNPLQIRNRLSTCSATQAGETRGMVALSYDGPLAGWTNGPVTQHDLTNHGLGLTVRGNVTGAWSYGGRGTGMQYNVLGEVIRTFVGGTTIDTTYNASTNWVAPSAITPNSNSTMQTTMSWNGWFAPTARYGANGASESVGYDAVGRPTGTNNADGTWTGNTYDDANRTSTVSVNGVATRTTYDGLGRPVKTEAFNGGAVTAISETEYQPCGCTPFGKVKRVSLPYAPGGSPQWTTMFYDAIGRTVQVQQPASSGTSTTVYVGNTVTVTDPAGRWKKYTSDALGNLTQVTEPNPQGGAAFETYYTYNVAGKMTLVSMPRPNVGLPGTTTQTRTFLYDTNGKLTSTTNPESGTVTYTYAGDLLDYKVDAKGQKVKFTYDAYERVKKLEPFVSTSATTPIECEVVENFYDQWASSVGRLSYQKWGNKDLTKCARGESRYEYQYTAMGRVTSKKMVTLQTRLDPNDPNQQTQMKDYTTDLQTQYEYQVGRLSKAIYPATSTYDQAYDPSAGLFVWKFNALPGHIYNYAYDAMGRSASATYQVNGAAPAQNMVWGVGYNAFSQMTGMAWDTGSMSWSYDTLGRLSGIPTLGITYNYSSTADDGKITSMTSGASTVNYSYHYCPSRSRIESTDYRG